MNKATFNTNLKLDYSGEEAINTVCSNLTFSGNNIKKVVITSCEPNNGKSFISMQTAINMGNRGKRVLLIDADMRMSVFNAHHDVRFKGSRCGLAHLLSGQCDINDALYETNLPNVYYIPIGAEIQAPLNLIATPHFEEVLNDLSCDFDLIIIDAPPIGMVIDAAEIARCCDGSIIILEYAKTRRRTLRESKAQMERTGTPVLGCVLNKVVMDRIRTKKYYGYGKYGYGKYGYRQGYYRHTSKDKD